MPSLIDLKERMTQRLKDLKALHEKDQRDAAEEERYDALLAEINDLGPQIDRAHEAETALRQLTHYTEPAGVVAARAVPKGVGDPAENGGHRRDLRSFGRRFVESEEFKRNQSRGDRIMKGDPFRLEGESFFNRDADARLDLSGMGPDELRALIYSGTPSASFLLPQVFPTIYRGIEKPLVMRDVLLSGRTTSDNVTVLRELVFTNAAAEVAEATLVSEGAKPESAITFEEATFPVRWIAHWIPITRQMLQDLPLMESYVNNRLLIGLQRREDNQFLNGNGTPPNLTGILVTSGIQDLNDAYFAGAAVQDAGTVNERMNRIRRAKTKIMTTGAAVATFVVANPADVEIWETATDAQRSYLAGSPFTRGADTIGRIWGLPVVESENIAAGTALVGDGTMAMVVDRMDAAIYTTDSHSDYFIRNLFVILAEERVALPVFRPAAFAKVDVTP